MYYDLDACISIINIILSIVTICILYKTCSVARDIPLKVEKEQTKIALYDKRIEVYNALIFLETLCSFVKVDEKPYDYTVDKILKSEEEYETFKIMCKQNKFKEYKSANYSTSLKEAYKPLVEKVLTVDLLFANLVEEDEIQVIFNLAIFWEKRCISRSNFITISDELQKNNNIENPPNITKASLEKLLEDYNKYNNALVVQYEMYNELNMAQKIRDQIKISSSKEK